MPSGSRKLTTRAVRRVLDAAVLDAELVESTGPLLELGAVGATERDVVEPDSELAEPLGGRGLLVLVQPEERAVADQVHGVVEVRVGVLVDHGLGVEERLVPRDADREIADGEGDVVELGEMPWLIPLSCRLSA